MTPLPGFAALVPPVPAWTARLSDRAPVEARIEGFRRRKRRLQRVGDALRLAGLQLRMGLVEVPVEASAAGAALAARLHATAQAPAECRCVESIRVVRIDLEPVPSLPDER